MKYELWQLRLTEKNRKKRFMSFKVLGEMGIRPQIGDYKLIYSGEVEEDGTYEALEKVFRIFNVNIPADFNGHSASVSDVIKINGRYYYIDPLGFKEVEGFDEKDNSVNDRCAGSGTDGVQRGQRDRGQECREI